MTNIIDGKLAAQQLRQQLSAKVDAFVDVNGITPNLTVILVGEDPASQVYVRNKIRQTQQVGMISNEIKLADDVSQQEILAHIARLNADHNVHGILVQLPLPKHIDEHAILEAIEPHKDVDGFHALNSGKLFSGQPGGLVPCTPQGCVILAKKALGDNLSGKHAVILGRSNIVGKPVAMLLLQQNCTVTIAHSRTENIEQVVRGADIVIAAVGIANFVKGDWIKPGATVIDVGINRIFDQQQDKYTLVGDVDFAEVAKVAGAITPVPGGVGPMTIACLLENTFVAATHSL
ncbi:bifunctional methylenetetrahydrofolate dehydrogenase/methenyltetrahydrofolate cyclohydrolase FolD [Thalassotalea sp. HSM 43]|uniref:bifunctional 5,10-methylenetetrahydrofolate dehydrogenase/5,10-methenyltetrahydrofolate cyclohydrolase n=1 Tax=Thalassotalea sp. HSM 43 TaxID=2552945 RepID=UPI0010815F97|nr:bifunctional methylenetetrahydrofolate dehydrogenase/methenyltetrahydrofolate cyclohydrolase FolD [Thalassotalea sp. HSM 43]QBY03007.1 bifunctional methylenetetrahydrofolate dehydrogenase/methenyltetrahydrofolate cyclohydrolase FolD [Thalassotalea sp. HSM 43]